MENGRPFDGGEYDERRSRQRRILRGIPGWLMVRHSPSAQNLKVDPADRSYVEALLRRRADELGDQVTIDFLEELGGAMDAERLAHFWMNEAGDVDSWSSNHDVMRAVEDIVDSEREDANEAKNATPQILELPNDARSAALYRLIVTLVFADMLSDDGYRDPRVRLAETAED